MPDDDQGAARAQLDIGALKPVSVAVAAEIMRAVYFETLTRIEQRDYDVFSTRTRVPKPVQALIALRQWVFRG